MRYLVLTVLLVAALVWGLCTAGVASYYGALWLWDTVGDWRWERRRGAGIRRAKVASEATIYAAFSDIAAAGLTDIDCPADHLDDLYLLPDSSEERS
jgi:hypothetical protein